MIVQCITHLFWGNFGKGLRFSKIWLTYNAREAVKCCAGSWKTPELPWDTTTLFTSGQLQLYWV